VEASLVHAGDSVSVTGPVELTPEVRYTVEADRETYWRVGTYDRYTGDGWVRTGNLRNYRGDLQGPPGESRPLEQRYTAETPIATLPAANKPVSIDDAPVPVRVTESGSFEPADTLREGESYAVESRQPVTSASELRAVDTDYPEEIERRYTQLPDSVPDRVEGRTDRLTANAENPYDSARVLERWFRENYNYSLDVERPRGDVADAFLFEMDAGYCVYFATTMVTMLRTQDVPARFVVGYSPGQQVDDDRWVVRGYNSHAWVEVYFPEHGWIRFDPTPSGPREAVRRERLSEARQAASEGDSDPVSENVDTNESLNSGLDGGTPRGPEPGGGFSDGGEGTASDDLTPSDGGDDGSDSLVSLPSPGELGVGLLVLAGLAAGARRTGAGERLYRGWWLRRPPEGDPEAVVAGAYRRVVHLQEQADREKPPGETPREFLVDADDRARRVGELYERARYGPGVDDADADEARRLLEVLIEDPPSR
jgi:MYXO-CTERM domain-containing protein